MGPFRQVLGNFYHPNVIGHEQIAGLAHDVVLSGRAASRSVGAVAGGGVPFDQLGTVPGVRMRADVIGQELVRAGEPLDVAALAPADHEVERFRVETMQGLFDELGVFIIP